MLCLANVAHKPLLLFIVLILTCPMNHSMHIHRTPYGLASFYKRIAITQIVVSIIFLIIAITTTWHTSQQNGLEYYNVLQVVVAGIGFLAGYTFISVNYALQNSQISEVAAGVPTDFISPDTRTCEGVPITWYHILGTVLLAIKTCWYIVEIALFVSWGLAGGALAAPIVYFLIYGGYVGVSIYAGRKLHHLINIGKTRLHEPKACVASTFQQSATATAPSSLV